MSRYNEQMKEEIGQAVKDWLVETYRFRGSEIEIYTHPDHEAYVTIEIDYNHDADAWNGFSTERLRSVVKDNTSHRVDSIPASTDHNVSIVPEGVRD